ncbi:FAD binding domain-containing protein [Cladophialophora immunda]|nr:FAD binding domain-containing protein [Cladophialophora immunda]
MKYIGKGSGPDGIAYPGSSNINVIVIGLGYAGVTAAIECHRKGHKVAIYEQTPGVSTLGDVIGLSPNAARIISKWDKGKIKEQIIPHAGQYIENNIHKHDTGEVLYSQPMSGYSSFEGYLAPRPLLMKLFAEYCRRLGIPIFFGHRVIDVFDNEDEAGIILDTNKRVTADCVLACDGVHSRARGTITGLQDRAYPTGYAAYRAWYDSKLIRDNPKLQFLFKGNADKMEVFIGPKMHAIIGTCSQQKLVTWTITHTDNTDVNESWTQPGKIEDALDYVRDWDDRIHEVIKHTPPGQIFDHKLAWRDPLPRWTSKHSRMMVLGDAAHPFLPTSGQGAGQAIEDCATIAICLELAGKTRVPLALQVCEKLRHSRASLAQKMGVETREVWHRTNWELLKTNPETVSMPNPAWLFAHNPQDYAYEEFDIAAHAMETGSAYLPTNVPPPEVNHRISDYKEEEGRKLLNGTATLQAKL